MLDNRLAALSLGQLIETGFAFNWSVPDPRLISPDGLSIDFNRFARLWNAVMCASDC